MSNESTVQPVDRLDPALLAAHPELAVLALALPDSDGEPVENERERFQITLLLDALDEYWHDRQAYYTAGNMFLYYSAQQARQILAEEAEPARPRRAFRGPDLFVVLDVDGSFRRQKWVVWEEGGRYPDVIFEFLSPSTRRGDQTTKKTLYEQTFKTREYYWYDPFDPGVFQGWQLDPENGYRAMTPDARGWVWSPALHLWIGRWEGTYHRGQATWLRFYEPEGQLLWTPQELAEMTKQQATAVEQRAEAAEQLATAAEQRAEAEHIRAATAEAELLRLRTELAILRGESR
jgi:Uma2 family endonuclease